MKLVRYRSCGSESLGVLSEGEILPIPGVAPQDMAECLSEEGWRRLEGLIATSTGRLSVSQVDFLPPLGRDSRVFCVGMNYAEHVAETGKEVPPHPTMFIRTHESFVGHGAPIVRPRISTFLDYEGELAVVIGQHCHRVSEDQALDFVGGYTCCNEGSVRDFQRHSVTGTTGKNFDATGSLGPWIVQGSAVGDPQSLYLTTRLNGEILQSASTGEMVYSVARIISYLSQCLALRPGDVITTGTPAGVGHRRQPQRWLVPGDCLEIDIGGVGVLVNTVIDEQ